MFTCGARERDDPPFPSVNFGDLEPVTAGMDSLYRKIESLESCIDRQSLVSRNAFNRQQDCVDAVQRLEKRLEQRVDSILEAVDRAMDKIILKVQTCQQAIPTTFQQPQPPPAPAPVEKPSTSAPPPSKEDIKSVAMEALGHKYRAIETQLQLVQVEVQRLGSQNHQVEESFAQHLSRLDAHQFKLDSHQSKLDANFERMCAKLSDFKPAQLGETTNNSHCTSTTIGTSPFVTPRIPAIQVQAAGLAAEHEGLALSAPNSKLAGDVPADVNEEEVMLESGEELRAGSKKQQANEIVAMQHAMGWHRTSSAVPKPETPDWDILTQIANSTPFTSFCSIMIVANIMYMGADCNIKVGDLLDRTTGAVPLFSEFDELQRRAMYSVELTFTIWMCIELFFNCWAARTNGCQDWRWNLFDGAILATSILQMIIGTTSLSVLRLGKLYRLIRVLRVGKALKVLRVFKFLKGVRKMVLSVVGSLTSLCWAFVLMSLIMYVVSIVFMQGIETFLDTELEKMREEAAANAVSATANVEANAAAANGGRRLSLTSFYEHDDGELQVHLLRKWYGSVGLTMLTLFRTISGGAEWAEVAEPVAEISFLYLALWVLFMAFMIFGVLNVLTGVFCDAAMKAANADRELVMQEMLAEEDSTANELKKFFEEADTDHSGFVSREEFEDILTRPEAEGHLRQLGLKPFEAEGLFTLLDDDESGELNITEFLTGAIKLQGGAKAVDMVTILFENKKMKRQMVRMLEKIDALTNHLLPRSPRRA